MDRKQGDSMKRLTDSIAEGFAKLYQVMMQPPAMQLQFAQQIDYQASLYNRIPSQYPTCVFDGYVRLLSVTAIKSLMCGRGLCVLF